MKGLQRWFTQHPRIYSTVRFVWHWGKRAAALGLLAGMGYSLWKGVSTTDTFWLGVAEILLIAGSVCLIYAQIWRDHEWNRRKASHDFLAQLIYGEPAELRSRLENEFGVDATSENQTYTTVRNSIDDEKRQRELYQTTSQLFNFFEQVGIGIKDHMLDEEICFDALHNVLIEYQRWGKPLIEKRRENGRDSVWTEFEYYALRWRGPAEEHQKRAEESRKDRQRQAIEDGRLAPKPRL